MRLNADRWLAGSALVSLAAIAVALVSQHVFDMQPCPWCVLQRAIFLAIALVCGAGWLWRSALGRRALAVLGLGLAAGGIASSLWLNLVASKSASCNLTLADKIVGAFSLDSLLPDVFAARANCADAAVKLLGVPYEFWSLALYALIAVAMLRTLRAPR